MKNLVPAGAVAFPVQGMFWLLAAASVSLIWILLPHHGRPRAGITLIAWGTLVIGLVDNLLRPILVGRDTRMPGYPVMIATTTQVHAIESPVAAILQPDAARVLGTGGSQAGIWAEGESQRRRSAPAPA